MAEVFISYSRKDAPFVRQLHAALAAQNRDTWVDWEDIPLTADWWREVQGGIEGANAFVFVISPDSVRSDVCRREIDHAIANNKRVIPILRREITEQADRELMHPVISSHNWIFFRETDSFEAAFQALLTALDTDLSYVRAHTRLLVSAREWDNNRRNPSFLLRGDNLREAEQWLAQAVGKQPAPLPLHAEYVTASRAAQTRRQRVLLAGVSLALVVAVGLALVSLLLFGEANTQRNIANQNAGTATIAQGEAVIQANIAGTQAALATIAQGEAVVQANIAGTQAALATVAQGEALEQANFAGTQAAVAAAARYDAERQRNLAQAQATVASVERNRAQSIGLAGQAQVEQAGMLVERAVLLALEALRTYGYTWQAERALALAVQPSFVQLTLRGHSNAVYSAVWSPEGDRVVTASADNTARIWSASGELEWVLRHTNVVNRALWSPDGLRIVTASADRTARIWDAETGVLLVTLTGHTGNVFVAVWSPDGTRIATASADNTARVWDAETGALLVTLTGHGSAVNNVVWSPDGAQLATASDDLTARVWDAATGKELVTLNGHTQPVNRVLWSPDGTRLATSSNDHTARLWDAATGTMQFTLLGHLAPVTRLAWSPTGRELATASEDETARIWNAETSELRFTLFGHTGAVTGVIWSPGGQRVVTTSADQTARIWDAASGAQMLVLSAHTEQVYSVDWSEAGDNIVTASQDGTAHIWQTWTTAQRLITFAQRCCAARILTDEERLQFGLPRLPSDPPPAEIESCPAALPSRLYAGTRAEVTDQDQLALRVRVAPGLNQTIIDQIPPLQTFRVLEGPQCTDGLAWFKVIFGISATEGWVAEGSGDQYFTRPVG